MSTPTRKPRTLGPVHLFAERPKPLHKGDNVALAASPKTWGRVVDSPPRLLDAEPLYVVKLDDGTEGVFRRDALLARFTSETRAPRR